MKQKKLHLVYFSPTGNTYKTALCLASELAWQICETDLSDPISSLTHFQQEELVLFAMPVFGGRIPDIMCERLKSVYGKETRAISAVIYGNRAYEDSLLELNNILIGQGFKIFASLAMVAEHSMVRAIASGRPDPQDQEIIKQFAKQINDQLARHAPLHNVMVPGNQPYKDWKKMPVVPVTNESCSLCGHCAKLCPADAIPTDNPSSTDASKCILCMRCIDICPQKARSLPAQAITMIEQKLSPFKDIRHENELFLI